MSQPNEQFETIPDVSYTRRAGRPKATGPDAERNPLHALTTEQRKTLFLDAAAKLFNERGIDGTSISDITGVLGLSKAIFYYYWDNKQEIVEEIHNRAVLALHQRLDQIVGQGLPPGETLRAAIKAHLQTVLTNKAVVGVLLKSTPYCEETRQVRRMYSKRFQQLVEYGMQAGAVRIGDPKLITFAILGLCNSISHWYRPELNQNQDAIIELFVGLAVEGYSRNSAKSGFDIE
jgi:AcrR family transcriptional regulator